MKALIGVGDSWTQGQGGIPLHFWDEWGGRVDRSDQECEPKFLHHELENSWVNVLCRDYYTNLTPINLGMRGYGNRGAVKNLYIYSEKVKNVTGGIFIFLLSSRIRFDLFSPQGYTEGRRRFKTFYPNFGLPNTHKPGEEDFYKKEYTEYMGTGELLISLLEAKLWADAHNMEFYFGSAFEFFDDLRANTEEHYGLANQLDWRKYFTPNSHYYSYLNTLNGTPDKTWGDYTKMVGPDKYITNDVHPTILGYKKIAEHMYSHIENSRKDIT